MVCLSTCRQLPASRPRPLNLTAVCASIYHTIHTLSLTLTLSLNLTPTLTLTLTLNITLISSYLTNRHQCAQPNMSANWMMSRLRDQSAAQCKNYLCAMRQACLHTDTGFYAVDHHRAVKHYLECSQLWLCLFVSVEILSALLEDGSKSGISVSQEQRVWDHEGHAVTLSVLSIQEMSSSWHVPTWSVTSLIITWLTLSVT